MTLHQVFVIGIAGSGDHAGELSGGPLRVSAPAKWQGAVRLITPINP